MRKLPEFRSPSTDELRALWLACPHARCTVLEVVHLRAVLAEVEQLRQSIERAWHAEAGGQLVALYRLRIRLKEEHERIGIIASPVKVGS